MTRVAVLGGHGKTGRAVCTALTERSAQAVPLGRADQADLPTALAGCAAAYLIAPNLHPDEPAYVTDALAALTAAGVGRVVYHSVASPFLQPGVYLQNLDLSGPVQVPYDVDAPFGFLDLADLGAAAATVLLEDGHDGATYELASRRSTVRLLAEEAGVTAERGPDPGAHPWLSAMFGYYDRHGLPAGTLTLGALLGR